MKSSNVPPIEFLRQAQILGKITPIGSSTLWRWVAEGKFPKPVKLSGKVTAWRASDVQEWVDRQGAAASERAA